MHRLPYPLAGGGGCVHAFFKMVVPPSDGTRPPGGVGQEWVGGLEGKGHIPGAKGAGKILLYIFVCVGQSASGWVPLELSPLPHGGRSSAVGGCQK